jgi:diguanylate cyclase (GGDEF)-like protein
MNSFYNSIIALTSPDNLEDLDQELVRVLLEIYSGCKILVYRGAYEEGKATNELSACSDRKTGHPDTYRYSHIQPVLAKYGERALATIVVFSQTPIQLHETFSSVLQVYTNQIAHVNRGSLDNLTGLLTRQSLQSHIYRIQKELALKKRRASDIESNYTISFLDIDHFKVINDKFGHLIGDEVLLLISQLMRKTFRTNDLLFRYGGEEFIIILSDSNGEMSNLALERFRKAIESFVFPQAEHLTVSIGYTALHKDLPYDVLLGCADKALYYAKENGRNCCHSYEDLLKNKLIEEQVYIEGDIELF